MDILNILHTILYTVLRRIRQMQQLPKETVKKSLVVTNKEMLSSRSLLSRELKTMVLQVGRL